MVKIISVKAQLIQDKIPHIILTSVVDPNTLNLDPDSEFWPNLDLGPDPENRVMLSILKKLI